MQSPLPPFEGKQAATTTPIRRAMPCDLQHLFRLFCWLCFSPKPNFNCTKLRSFSTQFGYGGRTRPGPRMPLKPMNPKPQTPETASQRTEKKTLCEAANIGQCWVARATCACADRRIRGSTSQNFAFCRMVLGLRCQGLGFRMV